MWISTAVWFSSAVEKTSERLAGMAVFRSTSLVITPHVGRSGLHQMLAWSSRHTICNYSGCHESNLILLGVGIGIGIAFDSVSFRFRLPGRAMARSGLRMMPTFPSPSLKFRTAGFPQYGFKAGISKGTFLITCRIKPAPGIPRRETSLSPLFACSAQTEENLVLSPSQTEGEHASIREARASLPQGSSAPVRVMLSHAISAYTTPCASPTGTLRFRGIALIRSAFAVRERLGDPRDLPDFHCCPFHACHRPYPGGPLRHPVVLTQRFQASSISERVATRYFRLYQQLPDGGTISGLHRSLYATARMFA
jgi:hypothetical protein